MEILPQTEGQLHIRPIKEKEELFLCPPPVQFNRLPSYIFFYIIPNVGSPSHEITNLICTRAPSPVITRLSGGVQAQFWEPGSLLSTASVRPVSSLPGREN